MENNVVLVGKKGFMSYMRSIELLMRKQRKKKIILKARGLNIKTAVDLVEASKNKFLDDLNISTGKIRISTIKFRDRDNLEKSVSCIEIEMLSR